RQGNVRGSRLLHGVLDHDPGTLRARDRTLDHDQATFHIGLDDLDVLRGDATIAHMARHLLVLAGLAGILPTTGRTARAVRHRLTMRGAQATEVPALHTAGKALTDGGAGHVDQLTFGKMVGLERSTNLDEVVRVHAELSHMTLGFDLGDGVLTTHGLANILGLGLPGAQLQSDVTVLFDGPLAHHLAVLQAQHRHGDVVTVLGEDAGHPQLLCDQSRTHRFYLLVGALPGHDFRGPI